MNINKYNHLLLLFCGFIMSANLYASGLGVSGSGPVMRLDQGMTGHRELVSLTPRGQLLVGSPKNSSIISISIFAPGIHQGVVIIREIKQSFGSRSLLLTANKSLSSRIKRVTIFVKAGNVPLQLYERINQNWRRHNNFSVEYDELMPADSAQTVQAFVVNSLGEFLLVEKKFSGQIKKLSKTGADTIAIDGVNINRGISHWVYSIIILVLGFSISCWVHRRQKYIAS